jgi:hypothetical protein
MILYYVLITFWALAMVGGLTLMFLVLPPIRRKRTNGDLTELHRLELELQGFIAALSGDRLAASDTSS